MNVSAAAVTPAAIDLRLNESRPQCPHLFDDLLMRIEQRGQCRLRFALVFQPNRLLPVAAPKVFIA